MSMTSSSSDLLHLSYPPAAPQAVAAGTADDRPHLLVGWAIDASREPLLAALPNVRISSLDLTCDETTDLPRLFPIDVVLLRANVMGIDASPLLHDIELGLPEVVFVVDDAWSPERFALESGGYRYIVTRGDLSAWLPSAMAGLCALTRARRMTVAASANRPPPPRLPSRHRHPNQNTLYAAETRFREAYLRLLLSEHGSRRKAADKAGVPYRSFCEMLRRLRI